MAFINEKSTAKLGCRNELWSNVRNNTNGKKVLVIHDFVTSCVMAKKNEIYYITDDGEQKNRFVRGVINNKEFGNDDRVELIEDWKTIDKFIKEKFGENMKFDLIIGNPPYEGNLHLNILDKIKDFSDNIIFIHPSTWLEKPIWNRPSGLNNRVKLLKIIPAEESNEIFGIKTENLGITLTSSTGGLNFETMNTFENDLDISNPKLAKSIFDKMKNYEGWYNKICKKSCDGMKFPLRVFDLGRYYKGKHILPMSYINACSTKESNHIKYISCKNEKDRKNLFNFLHSEIVLFATMVNNDSKYIPDTNFVKELTGKEYNYICEEMKHYV